MKFISHPEGYIEPDGAGGYNYVYQYKDHLGNIRLSYADSNDDGLVESSEIRSEKNYYPFGLIHQGYNSLINGTYHNWDYQGQERQEEFGLNWLTFRYRNYMPEIGRFFGVDPVSEDYMSISTYQFAHNNPVWKIELEGLEGVPANGFDQINHEPVTGHTNTGSSAIPIGDSTAGSSSTRAIKKEDNSSFLDGWNSHVGKFNNNFWNGFQSLMESPVKRGGKIINDVTVNTAQLVADGTGVSNLMG